MYPSVPDIVRFIKLVYLVCFYSSRCVRPFAVNRKAGLVCVNILIRNFIWV